MIALPLTYRQLAQDRSIALCLYHVSNPPLQTGICIEVRSVENGELLSEPMVVRDNNLFNKEKDDPLDKSCAAILEKVRLMSGPNPKRRR